MRACKVKKEKRFDIIKIYGDYLHEYIADLIREFWDKHYSQFQTL
jgi:hypothetical protein